MQGRERLGTDRPRRPLVDEMARTLAGRIA